MISNPSPPPPSALFTDFYELTMMQGYQRAGIGRDRGVFDLFFRRIPFQEGYAIAAGLEDAVRLLTDLRFADEEIEWLRRLDTFSSDFLERLPGFRFTGDTDAIPEGTVIFPFVPVLRITAPLEEAQLVESALLNIINFQSLIATKAARICAEAGDGEVIEFGLRRAHGPNGAYSATRAAFIGGCAGASNVSAARALGIPARGTMAHS